MIQGAERHHTSTGAEGLSRDGNSMDRADLRWICRPEIGCIVTILGYLILIDNFSAAVTLKNEESN